MSFCLIIVPYFVKIQIPFRFLIVIHSLLFLYFCKGTKSYDNQRHKCDIPLKLTIAKLMGNVWAKK